jgi:CelD/BcsL family acetyltransferase involved in cellulose biosynthesis
MYFDPKTAPVSLPRPPSSQKKRCSAYRFTATLDYPESAPLAALLARLVAILRRRSNPLRTQWCRLCHGSCHTPLQYNGWVSANNVIQTSCQPPGSEHDPEWP